MNENEKIKLKSSYHFINNFLKNKINTYIKVITPNKHLGILFRDNNNKKNRSKTNNLLFLNKRNINNGILINKSNTNNILPLLNDYNKNKNKNKDLNKKNENEKYLTNKSRNSSYSKDKFASFRQSKSNKIFNTNYTKIKKGKISNIKNNFNNTNKKDEYNTSINISLLKSEHKILYSTIKYNVNFSSIKSQILGNKEKKKI